MALSRSGCITVNYAARQHIEEIRRSKFSIGAAEPNPLTEDLHHAVRNLSAELYSKDVHFLMELIQNAEDNEYSSGVNPALEFVITYEDITGTGALATLLVYNNEVGFSKRNIESVCSVGRSTKKGRRQEGFIGEKGIGFKSVFLISSNPYVFSNGYQIGFTEEPDPCCGIGYIVPSWVNKKPALNDIQRIYGPGKTMPTTTIILPLRSEKVKSVKQQLSRIHPELLLFLAKIKKLSVREIKMDANAADTVSAISISSETDFRTQKLLGADSHIVFLSAQEGSINTTKDCHYYMWRQRFPVKPDCRVVARKEIEEWVISLAFPFGERLRRGASSAGIYAYLPTEMVTGFPFIIQADFILASSRETILLDSKWNQGILDCVPNAFVNAVTNSVKSVDNAPISSVASTFKFLPVKASSIVVLNRIREAIRTKLQAECIIPYESFSGTRVFCRPRESGRLLPAFRNILLKVEKQGLTLKDLSPYGKFILHSALDHRQYSSELSFLGIKYLSDDWYAKYIKGLDLVFQASEDLYLEILCFVADNWVNRFSSSIVMDVPLLKYVNQYNKVVAVSFRSSLCPNNRICVSRNDHDHAWLNKWNMEFGCSKMVFMPNSTQIALERFHRRDSLISQKLGNIRIEVITSYQYAKIMYSNIAISSQVIRFTHFLIHSLAKNFISSSEADDICAAMPIVNKAGYIILYRRGILIPATGSKWVSLLGSNPWSEENYVELGEEYARSSRLAGEFTSKNMIQNFARLHIKAADVPELWPPDSLLPVASSGLGKEQAFLLLEWLRSCMMRGLHHNKFVSSIQRGSWLRTSSGFESPNSSFLLNEQLRALMSEGKIFARFPAIDEHFYDNKINSYIEELKYIGVKSSLEEACQAIAYNLLSNIEYTSLSREAAIPFLKFISYAREKNSLANEVIGHLRRGIYLKTSQGYKCATESVLLVSRKEPFLQIIALPFIDEAYYGTEIRQYTSELEVLGTSVTTEQAYGTMVEKCAFLPVIPPLTEEVAISLLTFVRHLKSRYTLTDHFLGTLKGRLMLMTPHDSAPITSFVLIPGLESVSEISDLWYMDDTYYGKNISTYVDELDELGVITKLDKAYISIVKNFRFPPDLSRMTKGSVLLLLRCIKHIRAKSARRHLVSTLDRQPWLKTSFGFKTPAESFFPDIKWESLLRVVAVPRVDEAFYGSTIIQFKDELRTIGVTVDFDITKERIVNYVKVLSSRGSLTKDNVISLLYCCKILSGTKYCLLEDFRSSLIDKQWLKTRRGLRSASAAILLDAKWRPFSHIFDLPIIDDAYYGTEIFSFGKELEMMGVILDIEDGYKLLVSEIKFPREVGIVTSDYAISLLKFTKILGTIKDSGESLTNLINMLQHEPWLKTNLGFKPPSKSFLSAPEWDSVLQIVEVPVIDTFFYGNRIQSFASELHLFGVVVDFPSTSKAIASMLKTSSCRFSLTKINVLKLLDSLKCLKGTTYCPVEFFRKSLTNEKWLMTKHGYQSARESVLFDSTWQPISQIADLPFLDNSFYGDHIFSYKEALKMMGVTVDHENGFQFVAKCLKLPEDASSIEAASVISLLQCVRYLLAESNNALPNDFLSRIRSKWLKTCMGYRSPEESFLFNSNPLSNNKGNRRWALILESKDAPFIDEKFYGTNISLYKDELRAIGVNVEVGEGLAVLANVLFSHTKFPAIKRIYKYLHQFKWKPESGNNANYIWIPGINSENGGWVGPRRCVISDSDDLFDSRFHVLDKYYEKTLLPFFSYAFSIKVVPSTDDYLALWNHWEVSSVHQLTYKGCCAFWAHIVQVWSSDNAVIFKKRITKFPTKSAHCDLRLVDKEKIFIADDLQLEQIFSEVSEKPLFVWHPQPSLPSIPLGQLYEIFMNLGVQKISEAAQKGDDICSISTAYMDVGFKDMLIGRGLIILVLGFLSDPQLKIPVMKRHEMARSLIKLDVLFTQNPVTVSYSLSVLSRTKHLSAKASKMVSWEKDSKRLIVQKPEKFTPKLKMEFGFYFARAVSEGLFWENTDLIQGLSRLIQSGCVLEFDADAMESLLKMENLRMFEEDVKFLASAFPSTNTSKRKRSQENVISSLPITRSISKRRQQRD